MLTLDPKLTEAQAHFLLRYSARPLNCNTYCAHAEHNSVQASCAELCCKDYAHKCGTKALDIYEALKQTKIGFINFLFCRSILIILSC